MKHIFISLLLINSLNADLLNSILSYKFDEKSLDINKGKELYINTYKCNGCHGLNGEKSSGTFPKLTSKSAQELRAALKSYKNDNNYGGRTRFAMQRYAKKLSSKDMDNIVYYIKGKGNLGLISTEPNQKTEYNLYLE